jgi:lipopolysaccharide/colanic/teichoic acid biosynthesis glycosyltransferase
MTNKKKKQRFIQPIGITIDHLAPVIIFFFVSSFVLANWNFDAHFTLGKAFASVVLNSVFILAIGLHTPQKTIQTGSAFISSLLSLSLPQFQIFSTSGFEYSVKILCVLVGSSALYCLIRPLWMVPVSKNQRLSILIVDPSDLAIACKEIAEKVCSLGGSRLYDIQTIDIPSSDVDRVFQQGDFSKVRSEIHTKEFDLLVFSPHSTTTASDEFDSLLNFAKASDCLACTDISFYRLLTGSMPIDFLPRIAATYQELLPDPRQSSLLSFFQRLIDLIIASIGLSLMVLLIPFVAILNFASGDFGPLFYKQVRVGLGGAAFNILKFRSMKIDAEKQGAQWASKNDSRITFAGKVLRLTRIDEIPQFVNVLRGEMAVVGPRPERPELIELIKQQVPFYEVRHLVKPGITGWAQINFRYGNSVDDSMVKLRYDLEYVKRQSLWLDLIVIIRTPVVMISKIGY